LRRTKCGLFTLNDTILLENLKNMVYVEQTLLPLETSLRDIAVMAVSEVEASKLKQGQALSPKGRENFSPTSIAAAVFNGVLIAIVRIEESRISPIRVFNL
jgi:tRNA pseudouridine55 synthase